jgi:hypothetical protein
LQHQHQAVEKEEEESIHEENQDASETSQLVFV